MASLRRRKGSKNYFACITLPDGRRKQFATGREDRSEALRIAEETEYAFRQRMSEAAFLESMRDVYRRFHGRSGCGLEWIDLYVASKKPEVTERTFEKIEQLGREIRSFAKRHRIETLDRLDAPALLKFRAELLKRKLSAATVNVRFQSLRTMLKVAVEQEVIVKNPALSIKPLRETRSQRRAFSQKQIEALLAVATPEWKGMILGGYWTAQRISDLANADWEDIDLVAECWSLRTRKTGADLIIPLGKPFLDWLLERAGDKGGPVFPSLAGVPVANLSQGFTTLMNRARIDPERVDIGGLRKVSRYSFHCLRHTLTTDLKASGASEAIAMALVGHKSRAVSQRYTHIDTGTLKAALAGLELREVSKANP